MARFRLTVEINIPFDWVPFFSPTVDAEKVALDIAEKNNLKLERFNFNREKRIMIVEGSK